MATPLFLIYINEYIYVFLYGAEFERYKTVCKLSAMWFNLSTQCLVPRVVHVLL